MKFTIFAIFCALLIAACAGGKSDIPTDDRGMLMPSTAMFDRGADPHVEKEAAELNK